MNLQNGKFYTTADGTPVKAQLEADGCIHCYNAKGQGVHKIKADGHVEGWAPVGAAVFADARKASKAKPAKKEGKGASSTDKSK